MVIWISFIPTVDPMGENWLHNVGEKAYVLFACLHLPQLIVHSGLSIWRIDNKSKQLSKEQTSTRAVLRSDDCYVLLYVGLLSGLAYQN